MNGLTWKQERHSVTLSVETQTWQIFQGVCKEDTRSAAGQIGHYLELMSGFGRPNNDLEARLLGLFDRVEHQVEHRAEGKILPFPEERIRRRILARAGWTA